jgi:hypothetical protein
MQPQQESTTSVVENKEQIQEQNNTQNSNSQVVEQVENEQEKNWKKFREQREVERKQLEEERKRAKQKEEEAAALKAAMDALLNKPVNSMPIHDQYQEESEDEKIQKKVEAALLERERKLEDERRKKEQAEMPIKLNQAYKDFDQVCSAENLDYIEYHYPEVATPFKHMPNSFEKWASIYQAIKRFVPNTDSKKDQKKAEKNFTKPQAMSAAGATQTGDQAPIMIDDKKRADNWARMQKVMKGGR